MAGMINTTDFMGWSDCLSVSNAETELIVATQIGLRILKYGFKDGENLLHIDPATAGLSGGNDWRIYGGHRLWHAPEAMPRSYSPDNAPIQHHALGDGIRLVQPVEPDTGIRKEMDIFLSAGENRLTIVHRLVNEQPWSLEMAPWAISAMRPGGCAVVPQEPYQSPEECLLPVRAVALWPFTRMNDPRWHWGEQYILAKQDPAISSEQKIGVTNTRQWLAYAVGGDLLIKLFDYQAGQVYPDFGSNTEIYFDGHLLEVETLGPLTRIPPGGQVEHTEHWQLSRAAFAGDEDAVRQHILPGVEAFRKSLGR